MSSETSSSFEVSRTLDTYCLNQILDNRSLESSGESWIFLKYLVPDAFLNTVFNQCIKRFPTLKRAKQTSCFYWKKTFTVSTVQVYCLWKFPIWFYFSAPCFFFSTIQTQFSSELDLFKHLIFISISFVCMKTLRPP